MSETVKCRACGKERPAETAHCPHCLSATHDSDMYGETCGGTLIPISIWVKPDGTWEVIGRCSVCGELEATPVQEGDNPILLLSLADKPLANPPFPIEKMDEMTAAMGGDGHMGGYDA